MEKFKGIQFYYYKLFLSKNFSLKKTIIFIIFLIIIYLTSIKAILSNNNNNYYKMRGFINSKKKVKYSTNSTLNKGFLEINSTHKGKFTYYDYASNIKILFI
jgi:TM2 domain-containing membrane protein YozV